MITLFSRGQWVGQCNLIMQKISVMFNFFSLSLILLLAIPCLAFVVLKRFKNYLLRQIDQMPIDTHQIQFVNARYKCASNTHWCKLNTYSVSVDRSKLPWPSLVLVERQVTPWQNSRGLTISFPTPKIRKIKDGLCQTMSNQGVLICGLPSCMKLWS